MYTEITIEQLAEKYGNDKKIRIICEDEDGLVFLYSKNQKTLSEQEYSFDAGM